jgi:hypothetical protein
MVTIKLVGVSVAELELALKYSGLYVEVEGNYAEIKAIPEFLKTTPSNLDPQNKQLQEIKDKLRAKTAELKTQVEEMGYKVTELAVHLGGREVRRKVADDTRLADIEFWEKLQDEHKMRLEAEGKL